MQKLESFFLYLHKLQGATKLSINRTDWIKCFSRFRLNFYNMISFSGHRTVLPIFAIAGLAAIISVTTVEAELRLVNVVRTVVA